MEHGVGMVAAARSAINPRQADEIDADGLRALRYYRARFEDAHGVRASSWLDHVWSGISDGIGTWTP